MTSSRDEPRQLERSLSNRHIQLIAVGGAIGTGLFMGSGETIRAAGPSLVLVHLSCHPAAATTRPWPPR